LKEKQLQLSAGPNLNPPSKVIIEGELRNGVYVNSSPKVKVQMPCLPLLWYLASQGSDAEIDEISDPPFVWMLSTTSYTSYSLQE